MFPCVLRKHRFLLLGDIQTKLIISFIQYNEKHVPEQNQYPLTELTFLYLAFMD
ncbi:hypothetical protein HMPREF0083_02513 [Aneurinibacillus aneurinilyticus ATCC 12856]|uniref:Uncharacterized protein n=1 Tax=Aneurinibacillus aneurinilyticus ATCC 12856 TaxID=649747 RepID=U1WLE1_ANEAE|nr:hypothetical protein HMPREF0083_02513 [Aneurinibacillus aneurinilyticus ATCC 12856]